MADDAGEGRVQQVRLVTRLPDELRVPRAPLAVPARLARYGLSEVVNSLLAAAGKGGGRTRPFDFLIEGELLRTTLEGALLAKGLSAERVVELEYVPAAAPPEQQSRRKQSDWVGAVAGLAASPGGDAAPLVVTGSYDSVVRLHDPASGDVLASCAGHSASVVAAAALGDAKGELVATAAKDATVRLWRAARAGGGKVELQAVAEIDAHADAAQCVAAGAGGRRLLTGGWDGAARLWDVASVIEGEADGGDGDEGEGEGDTKRRRTAREARAGAKGASRGDAVAHTSRAGALLTLEGHSQCVSGAAWLQGGSSAAVTASWDRSLRLWDLESGKETRAPLYATKAVHALDAQRCGSGGLVATGGVDPAVQLWDVRAAGSTAGAVRLAGHTAWVSCVAWADAHVGAGHLLASSSHDGSVKVWDVRASVPLHTLKAHEGKALCVTWTGGSAVASGGADGRLATYSHKLGKAAANE